jgi:nucleoside-diphosphate-sugar epimerase
MNPLVSDIDDALQQTEGLWEPLRNKSIFMTGGTGFVGTWLTETLASADSRFRLGIHLTLLTRDPEKFRRKAPTVANHPSVEFLKGDSTSFRFPSGKFQFVIHSATETSMPPSSEHPDGSFNADIASTIRVLEFASGAGAERFLFTSSGAVYGRQPADIPNVPEDYAGAPSTMDSGTAYGHAKRASEFLCGMYARQFGFEATIARLFAFVGPHLPLEGFAVGNFIRDALQESAISIHSDGSTIRSYLYGSDLAIWLWTILLRGQSLRPYNVGSSKPCTVRQLAETIATISGKKLNIAVLNKPGVPATRYVPDTSRAENELKLKARVPLEEALRRTLAWNRLHALQEQHWEK